MLFNADHNVRRTTIVFFIKNSFDWHIDFDYVLRFYSGELFFAPLTPTRIRRSELCPGTGQPDEMN